jgi:hypothetical protein
MNELYGQTCSCCHAHEPRNEATVSSLFTPELMARLLADIFARKFNVEDEIYPELYEAARDTFERALEEGYPMEETEDADRLFHEALKNDADVFAAFRTHRMQNDIASQLLDEDGRLKEFRRFQEDAESVIGTYNNHWLRTEYDTAVLRARYAADWKRFSRNADILPNLKWMPTTSADPDVFHREYWRIGLTLPKTHPFWKNHHPHDRWGCKCDLEETDDPVTGIIPEVDYRPSPGLENNPGLEPELFSHTHPYYEKAYPGAEKAVMRLRRKEIQQEAEKFLEVQLTNEDFGKTVSLTRKGIKEWTNQPHMHYMEKNEMLLRIDKVLKSSRYMGSGPDEHNASIIMHLFETEIEGDKTWIIVREMSDGTVRLHSISDSRKILEFIKKRNG